MQDTINYDKINPDIEQIQAELKAYAQQIMDEPFTIGSELSAKTLLQRENTEIETLIDPILPRVGIASLIGSSDCGKSSFLRSLAMHIVAGEQYFLGFRVRPKHYRALYVSTEDEENSISVVMRRQAEELGYTPERLEELRFLFDTENLFQTLDAIVRAQPHDLVVLDAFSDLFVGNMNDNNQVRQFLNRFHDFALEHSLLVLFLHHTGKRTESLTPSKHNAIGSQGFEAKMRFVAELRQDPDPQRCNLRHFCIVKGNYLPPFYKRQSYELNFTQGLNFTLTGNRVDYELIKERTPEEIEREQLNSLKSEGRTIREIAEKTGISRSKVGRILKTQTAEQQSLDYEAPF